MQDRSLKLPDVSRRLGVSYLQLFHAVVSGRVPAHRDRSGSRWLVRETDLGKIAQVLGCSTEVEGGGDGNDE